MATAETTATMRLAVDRVACSAHGICAALLPHDIELDEWGYPILLSSSPDVAHSAITMCPARALSWTRR